MEITQKSLKTRQLCLFFIAFIPINKLFVMPSVIAGASKQDMWISTLISIFVEVATLGAILFFLNKEKEDIFTILKQTFGKVGSKIILSLFLVYFLAKSLIPLSEQKDYVELTLYITRPNAIVYSSIFAVIFYIATKKLRVVGRCADLFFATSVIGITALILLSLSNFDISAVKPIGVSGLTSIANGSYLSSVWFGDAIYMLFFVGEYVKTKKSTLKIILSYLFSGLLILIFIILFYSAFSSIAYRQRFALTEVSKYTTVINTIGRFDFIVIFMILASGVITIALPIFFASKIISELFNVKNPLICSGLATILPLVWILFCGNYFAVYESVMTKYGSAYFILIANILPILIGFIRYIKRKSNSILLLSENQNIASFKGE